MPFWLLFGRQAVGDFSFLLNQFWFTSGFFLLLLLSLIDQPHFSKNANVFINATTAWISLLLVAENDRDGFWWIFFSWTVYLIVSSYILMWVRSDALHREGWIVKIVSRINREIGRPEAIFSAFFLWGCIMQFGIASPKLHPLFLFWAVFMILNLPAISSSIEQLFNLSKERKSEKCGVLLHIINPRIADVALSSELSNSVIGHKANFKNSHGDRIASGIFVDDRIVTGNRFGRVAITQIDDKWNRISESDGRQISVDFEKNTKSGTNWIPISVVDVGTDIGKIVFHIHPNQKLNSGEVLGVSIDDSEKIFYQVVSATICETSLQDGNSKHSVRVTAGQLGKWNEKLCCFETTSWVAPAGQVIYKVQPSGELSFKLPQGHESLGQILNSDFPVHVCIDDFVTHNAAIIGITGSGKSYIAFHIIESIIENNVKVLILDLSRQHDLFLRNVNPTALKAANNIKDWWESDSKIGIHQFAVDNEGFPKITADFVDAAFKELSKAKLERGRNYPARLCIVFEEAHSLIPEWNQVAQQGDTSHVNRAARTILQGRKFGMGALIITQRTANVTKTLLNQCNTILALQSFDQTGLDFLKNYMGEEYSHAISSLPKRNAIIVGKASSSTRPLIFSVTDFSDRWIEPESDIGVLEEGKNAETEVHVTKEDKE